MVGDPGGSAFGGHEDAVVGGAFADGGDEFGVGAGECGAAAAFDDVEVPEELLVLPEDVAVAAKTGQDKSVRAVVIRAIFRVFMIDLRY